MNHSLPAIPTKFIAFVIIFFLPCLTGCQPATDFPTPADALAIPSISITGIVTETPPPSTPTNSPATYTPTLDPVEYYTYTIVSQYDHDPNAFTQGLVISDGRLYESTGRYGESSLRRIDIETGEIEMISSLTSEYFGEGLTVVGDKLIQLTWTSGTGFVYEKSSFELIDVFQYEGEGWGITFDGEFLYMSDGTSTIRILDPANFSILDTINVLDKGQPVTQINELEYINGVIYANIWKTTDIAIINPQNGLVTGWVNLQGIVQQFEDNIQNIDVLNGIAYDRETGKIYITGKLWTKLFEIELVKIEH